MANEISDVDLIDAFTLRKRRQWRLFWAGILLVSASMALAFVAFGRIVTAWPAANSPVLMVALLGPLFLAWGVIAARFTGRNMRCPACDQSIPLFGSRYYRSDFRCPGCARTLAR